MAFSPNLEDRERDKFVESPSRPGYSAVEIVGNLTTSSGPFAPPSTTDFIQRSVAGPVETYEYFNGGSGGTLLKTITVTYTSGTLQDLVSVEVS